MRELYLFTSGTEGSVYEVDKLDELDFVDSHFEQLFTHFPELYTLGLSFDCTLSAKALLCLAENCPRLGACSLPSDVDLSGLQLDARTEIAFPNLLSLRLESLYSSQCITDESE